MLPPPPPPPGRYSTLIIEKWYSHFHVGSNRKAYNISWISKQVALKEVAFFALIMLLRLFTVRYYTVLFIYNSLILHPSISMLISGVSSFLITIMVFVFLAFIFIPYNCQALFISFSISCRSFSISARGGTSHRKSGVDERLN